MAETSIVFDYEISEVRIFTDRESVANGIRKRSGNRASITESKSGDRVIAWSITLPLDACRAAALITKVMDHA